MAENSQSFRSSLKNLPEVDLSTLAFSSIFPRLLSSPLLRLAHYPALFITSLDILFLFLLLSEQA